MPLFSVSPRFSERLRAFDSALRCRWSDALGSYLIERKVSRAKPIEPKLLADDEVIQTLTEEMEKEPSPEWRAEFDHRLRFMAEEYRAALDGYVVLFEADRECLDNRVFFTLFQGDIWRRDGADKVNDEIDQAQAECRRESRARWMDEVRQRAKAAFRYMNRVRTVPERFAHTAPVGGMSIND
jgi:hypothetical protein